MACSISTFRLRFPEFSDEVEYPDDRIQLFLDDTALIYMGSVESRWCGKYDYAHCYASAHLLTLGTNSEVGDTSSSLGPISSKSVDGVSITRAISQVDRSDIDNFFMGTVYGQTFLNIRNTCFAGIIVNNVS